MRWKSVIPLRITLQYQNIRLRVPLGVTLWYAYPTTSHWTVVIKLRTPLLQSDLKRRSHRNTNHRRAIKTLHVTYNYPQQLVRVGNLFLLVFPRPDYSPKGPAKKGRKRGKKRKRNTGFPNKVRMIVLEWRKHFNED